MFGVMRTKGIRLLEPVLGVKFIVRQRRALLQVKARRLGVKSVLLPIAFVITSPPRRARDLLFVLSTEQQIPRPQTQGARNDNVK